MRKSRVFGLFLLAAAAACSGATNDASPSGADGDAGAGPVVPTSSGLPCDVDAVLAKNCRGCHSAPPKFGAPMSLSTYEALTASAVSDSSKKVYQRVLERVADDARPMPPEPNERLSAQDRATLQAWSDAGAPRSADVCNNETVPKQPPGVKCTPDVQMRPASKWSMPKDTKDEYVCYGFDITRSTPTHVVGFQPKIDNAKIVHHVVLFEAPSSVSPTPAPCSGGGSLQWRMITGWAPGGTGMELPPNVGFPLADGGTTHYVLQVHYSNLNALDGEIDGSGYDLCTSAPRAEEADVVAFGSQKFSIPATGQPYTIDCTIKIPSDLAGKKLLAAMPHMHQLGTAMSTTLERSGAAPLDLGTVNGWSFSNQTWMAISGETQANDVVRTKCTWTNDTGAPVGFGEKTSEEMCYSFTMYYPRVEASLWSWAAPALASKCTTP